MSLNASIDPGDNNTSTNGSDMEPIKITDGPIFDGAARMAFQVFVYPFALIIGYIVVGLIGNCIVIYVFSFKWRKNKNTVFILTLAGLDIVSCGLNMPVEAMILLNFLKFDFHLICKISRFTTYIVSASYSFVLVAIAVDRFIMVCRPFKGKDLNIPYAKRTCIGAVVLSILTQWPSLFFYGTYTFKLPVKLPNTNLTTPIFVEAKTCLVSNDIVDIEANHKYLYAFYAFLFLGHVVIFIIFISVYMHIGRKLFLASHVTSSENHPKRKLWKMSVVSAFTGALPKSSLCSRGSRTMSTDNVYIQARRPLRKNSGQISAEIDKEKQVYFISNGETSTCNAEQQSETDLGDIQVTTDLPDTNQRRGSATLSNVDRCSVGRESLNISARSSKRNSARESLRLNIGFNVEDIKDSDPRYSKTSDISAGSERPLLPFSPLTAPTDSAKPLFIRRSHSEDLSGRFSVTQMGVKRKLSVDIKEISLKQNTLIMRMVTFCYMISYLPFLVIVCIRYIHPHIPGSLTGVPLIVYHVFLRSYFLNSVIRPFIYIFMNNEYRSKVWGLIRCKTM